MGDKSVAGSNLLLIPEILGGKGRPDGDFACVFPHFAALKHGRRKDELLLFAGRVAHLKPDQLWEL